MTFSQVYLNGKERLTQAGIESPAFDAICLFESSFGLNRQALAIHGEETAPNDAIVTFNEQIRQRCARRPLQYILGQWPFLDLTLEVGEGVLIPREDTEVLVRTADELLRGRGRSEILDLCAGSGAVGLGIASLLPDAEVTCVEFSDTAFSFLERNIRRSSELATAKAVRADVLQKPDLTVFRPVDAILSNPPYVVSEEIDMLQEEVRKEPREALDGGPDGLLFYRAIASHWTVLLKPGGLIALEVGEGQAKEVAALLESAGMENIGFRQDFNGIDRVVFGTAKRN